MPPFVIPHLVKIALGTLGAAAVVHWVVKEVRRINDELDRVRAAPTIDPVARQGAADAAARLRERRVAGAIAR